MQLDRVLSQPATPLPVVRPPSGDDLPELRAVAEHAKVCQFVDDHGFERLRRSQDQPPRKGQAPRPGATPPTRAGVADGDRGRNDRQSRRVPVDLALDGGPRPNPKPRFEDGGEFATLARAEVDHELVAVPFK